MLGRSAAFCPLLDCSSNHHHVALVLSGRGWRELDEHGLMRKCKSSSSHPPTLQHCIVLEWLPWSYRLDGMAWRFTVLCDSTKVTNHCSPVDGVSPCITFVLDALVAVILEVGWWTFPWRHWMAWQVGCLLPITGLLIQSPSCSPCPIRKGVGKGKTS